MNNVQNTMHIYDCSAHTDFPIVIIQPVTELEIFSLNII